MEPIILVFLLFAASVSYADEDQYHPRMRQDHTKKQHATGRDWNQEAQDQLEVSMNTFAKVAVAKNVILFIGDGMGVTTVTAARHYLRQYHTDLQPDVPPPKLAWDEFPVTGLSMTYNADYMTPDSAGTATAFLCGEKANYYTLGVTEAVAQGDCTHVQESKIRSAWKKAMDAGKAAGIVTTTRITHATPAGAYASVADRGYESSVPETAINPDQCEDIAYQLIHDEDNKELQVILGGGRLHFFPDTVMDSVTGQPGYRQDNRTLYEDWLEMKSDLDEHRYKYVTTKEEFEAVDTEEVDYLFGLLATSHLDFELDRKKTEDEPSLTEMVEKAIKILRKDDDGYFLLVEGGRIDHAHHDGTPKKSLEDVVAMHEAVHKAIELSEEDDETLIVVTADHSHVFTMAGYPKFEEDILGKVTHECWSEDGCINDYKPSTTVGYVNGPGFMEHRWNKENETEISRIDLTDVDTAADDFISDGSVPMSAETHGGEEVALYAWGPMSYLFMGTHEQHYVAHALMFASCVGDNKDLCGPGPMPTPCDPPGSSRGAGPMANVVILAMTTLTICIMRLLQIY